MPIINSVITQGGIQPTGTKNITTNGTHNVADYEYADVAVPTTAPDYYYEYSVVNGTVSKPYFAFNFNGITTIADNVFSSLYSNKVIPSTPVINMSSITTIGSNGCYQMFYNCGGDFSVNLSGLTTIDSYGCQYMFYNANCISVDLSSLTTISISSSCRSMFYNSRITNIDLSSLTTISGDKACYQMFQSCTSLTSIDLSNLTTISSTYACYQMFQNCTSLTSIDLSGLTTISEYQACRYMFQDCVGLTSVDLSGLTTISGENVCDSMFSGTSITNVKFDNLSTVTASNQGLYYMFQGCSSLISAYFPKLTVCPDFTPQTRPLSFSQMFYGSSIEIIDLRNFQSCGNYGWLDNFMANTSYLTTVNVNALEHIGEQGARAMFWFANGVTSSTLKNVYFPMLTSFGTNPFYTNAFLGRLDVTIHFRKDMQATVQALPNYSILWSAGTGSSVVFDLAGTLTGADSNSYTRSESNSVYASETAGAAKTATAWTYNSTLYYTNGTNEPSVGDTIYSDSACTTAVTTISSIA